MWGVTISHEGGLGDQRLDQTDCDATDGVGLRNILKIIYAIKGRGPFTFKTRGVLKIRRVNRGGGILVPGYVIWWWAHKGL